MLNTPSVLFYKALFRLQNNPYNNESLMTNVLAFACFHLAKPLFEDIDFSMFCSHGFFADAERTKRLQIASYTGDDGFHWAARLRVQDAQHNRRQWTTHLYLHAHPDEQTVDLYYAVFYHDYSALCFSSVAKPMQDVPSFIEAILAQPEFDCTDCGYQIPHFDIALSSQVADQFMDLLFHPERMLPLFVINGLDGIVDPQMLAHTIMGNGFVFAVANELDTDWINQKLPNNLRIPYDAIQIYLPPHKNEIATRTFAADRILACGDRAVFAALRKGFCESLRNEERRRFLTFDDVQDIRKGVQDGEKDKEIATLKHASDKLLSENERLKNALRDAEKRYEEVAAAVELDVWHELEAQEKVTESVLASLDRVKSQIDQITTMLFSGFAGHNVLEENPTCAEIANLREALKFRLPIERIRLRNA